MPLGEAGGIHSSIKVESSGEVGTTIWTGIDSGEKISQAIIVTARYLLLSMVLMVLKEVERSVKLLTDCIW